MHENICQNIYDPRGPHPVKLLIVINLVKGKGKGIPLQAYGDQRVLGV
jgi:hypothetical protein